MRQPLLARPLRRTAPPLSAAIRLALDDIEAGLGVAPSKESSQTPLWEPFPIQPGRGIVVPDGRILSPQQAAKESLADELAYGGAPGGGKTDLLLGLATTEHRASAIFRRQFAQFRGPKGMIARSEEIIGLRGDQSNNTWRNIDGLRALEFLGCDYEKDVRKYQGRPHDFKGFDEGTEIPESYYRRLIGWLRTDVVGQRTRVVVTFNPPQTLEGEWVLRYWAPWLDPTHPRPAKQAELRWFLVDADGKDVEVEGPWVRAEIDGRLVAPRSRTFVRSNVEDNPIYMRTGYANVLDALPEPFRSQMRTGDFSKGVKDHDMQVFPRAWVEAAMARWRPDGHGGRQMSAVGNDPSRGGQDEFVIASRYDEWFAPLIVYQAKEAPDGPTGARHLFKAVDGDTIVPIQIDIGGGAGTSVYDHAKLLKLNAVPIDGSSKTKQRDRSGRLGFANLRAGVHWTLREALDPASGLDIALPPDPQLLSDLCAPRWDLHLSKIKIEEKSEIKKRIGRSPDRGEAVIYAAARVLRARQEVLFSQPAAEEDQLAEVNRLRARLGLAPKTR